MPKKKSQETKDLEDQLRGMILGNVRIADDRPHQTQSNRPLDSPRGRGRGSGGGYVSPHLRWQQQEGGLPSSPTSSNQPNSPSNNYGAQNGVPSPQSPYNVSSPSRGSFGHHRNFSLRGSGPGQSSPREGRGSHQALFDPASPTTTNGASSTRGSHHQSYQSGPGSRIQKPPQIPPMEAFIRQCQHLDQIAAEEIPKVEMTKDEFLAKDAFRSRLETICREEVARSFPELAARLNLRAYGSIVSGFATKGSDVDLTIAWDGDTRSDIEFKALLPRVVEAALLRARHGARLLSRTRVPIIKVCEAPHDELYSALIEEREKWEQLPEEEKYPSLFEKLPESPTENAHEGATNNGPIEIDPDVSRSGKPMPIATPNNKQKDKDKPIPMSEDPLAFLLQLKSKARTEDDDLARYCQQFINARRFVLQQQSATAFPALGSNIQPKSQPDDQTLTEWFLEGLPTSIVQAMSEDRAALLQINAAYYGKALFEQYYDVAHPTIARLSTKKSSKNAEKPWLREKALGKLDFPKQGVGIQCDINFGNALGLWNTELLHCYSLCDPRVRPMVLFIKSWSKQRKINSAYSGTLSSYGYVLMVLHFLINIAQPPVLPNLQTSFGAADNAVLFPQNGVEYNISFYKNITHLSQVHSPNTEPLGVLLRNFYHYYSSQGPSVISNGFNYMRDVISIRTPGGLLTKESKGWTGAKTTTMDGGREIRQRYLLAIEDPFEVEHNVGRPVTHNGIVTVRDEFRRAWRILCSVGKGVVGGQGLFDEVKEAAFEKKESEPSEREQASAQNESAQATAT